MFVLRLNVEEYLASRYEKPVKQQPNRRVVKKKKQQPNFITFLDQNKHEVKYWIVGCGDGACVPLRTAVPCWGCHKRINGDVFGCPVDHITPSNNPHLIAMYKQFLDSSNITNYDPDDLEYFVTEGFFGSLRCVKAYILDEILKSKHPKYTRALGLLTLIQKKYLGSDEIIVPQVSWKFFTDPKCDIDPHTSQTDTMIVSSPNILRPYLFPQSLLFQEIKTPHN